MIFIKTSESINVSPEYEGISKRLSFSDLSELVSVDINAYNDLQKKFNDGNRLYPDLISSLFRKMYENGYTYRNIVRESLLSCSHFLQSKKFKFLGFIRRDNETDKDNNEIDYFTEWDFVENYYKLKNNSTQKKDETRPCENFPSYKKSDNYYYHISKS